jgi:hypothetical protein
LESISPVQKGPKESFLDLLVAGHFAERHFAERQFAERHFAERTVCRRTFCRTDNLTNGQFDERTFRRKDISPKGQLAENSGMFGTVTYFVKMFRVVTHYSVNYCVK